MECSYKRYLPLKIRLIPHRKHTLFPGTGVTTYAAHPGMVATEATRYADDSMFNGARRLIRLASPMARTPRQGAQTIIYCAVDEKVAGETGLYYR
jgi:NAD(P)-dependent dehydrogenase (short-subunit alcohol dehydrogenase family)